MDACVREFECMDGCMYLDLYVGGAVGVANLELLACCAVQEQKRQLREAQARAEEEARSRAREIRVRGHGQAAPACHVL